MHDDPSNNFCLWQQDARLKYDFLPYKFALSTWFTTTKSSCDTIRHQRHQLWSTRCTVANLFYTGDKVIFADGNGRPVFDQESVFVLEQRRMLRLRSVSYFIKYFCPVHSVRHSPLTNLECIISLSTLDYLYW